MSNFSTDTFTSFSACWAILIIPLNSHSHMDYRIFNINLNLKLNVIYNTNNDLIAFTNVDKMRNAEYKLYAKHSKTISLSLL